jgi:hypothetical protein
MKKRFKEGEGSFDNSSVFVEADENRLMFVTCCFQNTVQGGENYVRASNDLSET